MQNSVIYRFVKITNIC